MRTNSARILNNVVKDNDFMKIIHLVGDDNELAYFSKNEGDKDEL